MPGSPLVHARFTFDRTPFKRMHQALLMAATLPLTMQLLPPLQSSGSNNGSHSTAQHSTGQHSTADSNSANRVSLYSTADSNTANRVSVYRMQPQTDSHQIAGGHLPSDELFKAALTAPETTQQVSKATYKGALSVLLFEGKLVRLPAVICRMMCCLNALTAPTSGQQVRKAAYKGAKPVVPSERKLVGMLERTCEGVSGSELL